VPEGLKFDCSAAFFLDLSPDAIVNMTSAAGALDVTFSPRGTQGYRDLKRNAIAVEV